MTACLAPLVFFANSLEIVKRSCPGLQTFRLASSTRDIGLDLDPDSFGIEYIKDIKANLIWPNESSSTNNFQIKNSTSIQFTPNVYFGGTRGIGGIEHGGLTFLYTGKKDNDKLPQQVKISKREFHVRLFQYQKGPLVIPRDYVKEILDRYGNPIKF